MGDILVTTYPDGTTTRETWRRRSLTTQEAIERLQNGRRPPIPGDAGQGCQSPRHHPGQWWRT